MTLSRTSRRTSRVLCGPRRVLLGTLAALSGLLVPISVLAVTPAASAFTEPGYTGTFADFANCPADLPDLAACLHSYITAGAIQIGHAEVPISVPGDTLDLGLYVANEPSCEAIDRLQDAPEEGCVVSPAHGILNGPAQPVPGGLLGSIDGGQLTGVRASLEWAQQIPPETIFGIFTQPKAHESGFPGAVLDEEALAEESGSGMRLSLRVHLSGPFLGLGCYIGSAADPLALELTTGATSPPPPAEPLHGRWPEARSNPTGEIFLFQGLVLVDNSFSVPAATGCGALMDAAIDQKLGLPSPAGENTAVIDVDADQAGAEQILEHGWSEDPPEPAGQQPPAPEPEPPAPPAEPPGAGTASDPPPSPSAPQPSTPTLAASSPLEPVKVSRPRATPAACLRKPRVRHGKPKRCKPRRAAAGAHSNRPPPRLAKASR